MDPHVKTTVPVTDTQTNAAATSAKREDDERLFLPRTNSTPACPVSPSSPSLPKATAQYASEGHFVIACLPGDGIGPEVMHAAVHVLTAIGTCPSAGFSVVNSNLGGGGGGGSACSKEAQENAASTAGVQKSREGKENRLRFEIRWGLVGGAAWNKHSTHMPQETLDLMDQANAVLYGAVGGLSQHQTDANQVKWHYCERNVLLGLRGHLQLGVSLRPNVVFKCLRSLSPLKNEIIDKGVDILIVRELLGGLYWGDHINEGDSATDVMVYSADQISRALTFAFEAAALQQNPEKRLVTVIDKANILDCSRLWRKVAVEMAPRYPTVKLEFQFVDSAALRLVLEPHTYSVIVTDNFFGDILSDMISGLPGSLGLMPSVCFGERAHLYSPVGGSAPLLAGKNKANPIAMILSVALMLRYSFNLEAECLAIQKAVKTVLEQGYRTQDLATSTDKVCTTSELSERIAQEAKTILQQ